MSTATMARFVRERDQASVDADPPAADGRALAGRGHNGSVRWRWITWAILLFGGAMLIWASTRIGGGLDCAEFPPGTAARDACDLRSDVQSGIGVFAIGVVWLGGTLVLGVVWLVRRPPRRRCPRCGRNVRVGLTSCPSCGHELGSAPDEGVGP